MSKIITCILPQGQGTELCKDLFEQGHHRLFTTHVRGFDIHANPVMDKHLPISEEKEITTILLDDAQEADQLFEYIFYKTNMNKPGGGFMFMRNLSQSTPYQIQSPQDLPVND